MERNWRLCSRSESCVRSPGRLSTPRSFLQSAAAPLASILFIYPPTADPTGPYLSIPYLAAAVRAAGHRAQTLDLNLAGCLDLLTAERVTRTADECRARLAALPLDGLGWPEAAEYLALSVAVHDSEQVAAQIEPAVQGLREPRQFYDPERYQEIQTVLDRALALISARYYPLELSFTGYSTPFYLNSAVDIGREAAPDRNPFHESFERHLLPAVQTAAPAVVGISATFNAQLMQALAAAQFVKLRFPEIHVTLGGTAITQLALRTERAEIRKLGRFADSLILFEGENTLTRLLDAIDAGLARPDLQNLLDLRSDLSQFKPVPTALDLNRMPPPDYSGFELDRYLAPEPILYVAPTRGCYWTKCAFCHYGLADTGTAPYRRRDPAQMVEDLKLLQETHSARFFYFSGDLIDPRYLFELADKIIEAGLVIRFTSDLRIERSFGADRCRRLKQAGMVAAAFGTESDSPRLLGLMDKGTRPSENRNVFRQFAEAGIAVQAMTILDFPTETAAEANATLDLIEHNFDTIDLFFMEQFDLEAGSRVFQSPADYGLTEVFYPAGDRFRMRAQYTCERPSKRVRERRALVRRLDRLASRYGRRPYPYAGSVSVAHTLMYFEEHGREIFKRTAEKTDTGIVLDDTSQDWPSARPRLTDNLALCDWPYDLQDLAERVAHYREELEQRRLVEHRDVSRSTYAMLSTGFSPVLPRESYYLLPEVGSPVSIPCWLWMLASCFDGETSVAEAAGTLHVPVREATAAVQALVQRGLLTA